MSNSPSSWYNPEEAIRVVHHHFAYGCLLTETRRPEDIAIITLYHRQARKIRTGLDEKGLGKDIKVGLVEVFQGQERCCNIIATVRSES